MWNMAGATKGSPLKGEIYLSLTKDHFYSSVVDYLAQVENRKNFASLPEGGFGQVMAIWVVEFPRFLPKNQHTQQKLLNFVFWINRAVKMCHNVTFKLNFLCQKSSESFSIFFSLKNTNLGAHYLLQPFFDKVKFQTTLLLKQCPIFDSSPLIQNT